MDMGRWTLRKKMLVGMLVVLAGASVAGGSYYAWLINPPPMPDSPQAALATIGSKRYQRMPEYRQREYLAQAQKLFDQLPPQERMAMWEQVRADPQMRQAMRQVHQQMMVQRALEFARAEPQQRTQMLDEQIDRWEKMRATWSRRNRDSNADRPRRRHHGQEFQKRMMERFEHGNPQINSLIGEYFRAMRQRRQERGLTRR